MIFSIRLVAQFRTAALLGLAFLSLIGLTSNANAAYNLTISSAATSNVSSSSNITTTFFSAAGTGANLNVGDLTTALGSRNVNVSTGTGGSEAGTITVSSATAWSAKALTLDAYTSLVINATMSATGTAALTLLNNDGGSNGQISFNSNVSFSSDSQSLTINTVGYTLVADIAELASALTAAPSGYFALRHTDDESGTAYTATPISTTVGGTVEGLGNVIKNFTIISTSPNTPVALFNEVGTNGTISDLNVQPTTNMSQSIAGDAITSGAVAGLVYLNEGLLLSDSFTATGQVVLNCDPTSGCSHSGVPPYWVGGLVAENEGAVTNCSATAPLSTGVSNSVVGGLIAYNIYTSGVTGAAAVTNSSSGSSVAGNIDDRDGGLIGENRSAVVTGSNATGTVTGTSGYEGGLIGDSTIISGVGVPTPQVLNSYATGDVTGTVSGLDAVLVGGLIGNNDGIVGAMVGSTVYTAYAKGDVSVPSTCGCTVGGLVGSNSGSITFAQETGTVTGGGNVGGLVGDNSGTISQSFATRAVSSGSSSCCAGGLVGENAYNGSISNSYSLGNVTATAGSNAGGFVGTNGTGGYLYGHYLGFL